jgi:hypothetical protein
MTACNARRMGGVVAALSSLGRKRAGECASCRKERQTTDPPRGELF